MTHLLTLAVLLLAQPAKDSPVTLPGLEDENAGLTREQVLRSPEWRHTMLTLSTWFDTQKMYSAEQVLDFKREINRRARDMSPAQLLQFQHEVNDKLTVLNSPAAKEVKTYLREQLSLASDEYARRILAHLPDIARMSADEIQDYLNKFIAKANAEQQGSKELLQARNAQAQFVVRELNSQRQEADRAIDAAIRSGSWGGASSGVIGAKNITGGQIPTAAGYYDNDWNFGGWGWRW